MKKLIVMRGLPGSGKSTKAKELRASLVEQGWEAFRINRDLLRVMLHYGVWNPLNEGATMDVQMASVKALLGKKHTGKNLAVIIDDSNLTERHLARWKEVAAEFSAEYVLNDMETPIEICIERDAKRPDGERVGRLRIFEMAMQSGYIPAGTKFIVSDLDGTLAQIDHRLHFVKNPQNLPDFKKDWKGFFDAIPQDELRPEVMAMVTKSFADAEYKAADGEKVYKIIFSARPERTREATEAWLEKMGILSEFDTVIMRPDGDSRQDDEMKRVMYDRYLRKYNVLEIFDDRQRVIRVWKELGLNVTDVGPGYEY